MCMVCVMCIYLILRVFILCQILKEWRTLLRAILRFVIFFRLYSFLTISLQTGQPK